MTPTEQDEELQKAVWASLASQMTHAINCTDLEHEEQNSCEDFTKKNFEQLMQLIKQHREAYALEENKNGFFAACGVCGVEDIENVEEYYQMYRAELREKVGRDDTK